MESEPKKDIAFVIGELNTIVDDNPPDDEDAMGKFSHGQFTKRDEHLIEFCRDSDLVITNTFFKHGARHKTT